MSLICRLKQMQKQSGFYNTVKWESWTTQMKSFYSGKINKDQYLDSMGGLRERDTCPGWWIPVGKKSVWRLLQVDAATQHVLTTGTVRGWKMVLKPSTWDLKRFKVVGPVGSPLDPNSCPAVKPPKLQTQELLCQTSRAYWLHT